MKPACHLPEEAPYFAVYEDRGAPGAPGPVGPARSLLFQSLAVCALALGGWYLAWRWTASLNPRALVFSAVVAAAETLAWIGTALFFLSIWRIEDPPVRLPPRTVNDVLGEPLGRDRPLRVDVLITTLSEPAGLVRRSVRDAKALRYPHPLSLRILVLDDGRRAAMREMAAEEGVDYLARPTNTGFKAGNLRHALEHTDGDLFVVCDADTRLLPSFLAGTLGHFRDPRVAWVQTPQWFFDVAAGLPLPEGLARRAVSRAMADARARPSSGSRTLVAQARLRRCAASPSRRSAVSITASRRCTLPAPQQKDALHQFRARCTRS